MDLFKPGDIIKGQVTGIENYGIFININAEYNGLIHISEISEGFVKDINDFVKIGETIYCKVLEVDEENCNLKLSIKNINYKARKGKGKFNYENGKMYNLQFEGGCPGNLKAIGKLCEGRDLKEIATILEGNTCGPRKTSCADQLSKAIMEVLE